jgi:hypothetical protein
MSQPTFTSVHVIISLIGIGTGVIVIVGFLRARILHEWNAAFLVFTVATSITGFFFPFHRITPAIILGVISSATLLSCVASLKLKWIKAYVICVVIAEYLNVFVLVAQLFQKVPFLHVYAPKVLRADFWRNSNSCTRWICNVDCLIASPFQSTAARMNKYPRRVWEKAKA